ncbi:MAG TPA: transposase [Nitrospira sp.]|nr:transposase [Nitrospira sp.]
MMGTDDPQPSMFYHINVEQYVPADHPRRKIRPLIDTARIRALCEPLYADTGRPSIPPEQLFLAILGGYLLGVTSERALVLELTGNLVLRWFVGLDLDQMPWNHSTFSQNRKRRFTESGLLERLFDETVALAIKQNLVSHHTTLDGTLVQANVSHKSVIPLEVFLKPEEYKKRIRSLDAGPEWDHDPGNPTVTFRRQRRSNSDASLDDGSRCQARQQRQWHRCDRRLHHQRPHGESASAAARHQCRVVSWAGSRDGRRVGVTRSVSCYTRASDSDRWRG